MVIDREGHKGEVLKTVRYKFRGENHECTVHYGKGEIGEYYFIKILPDRPESAVLLEEEPVPECLFRVENPYDGWKTLPACK